jgi:hypothetical protein
MTAWHGKAQHMNGISTTLQDVPTVRGQIHLTLSTSRLMSFNIVSKLIGDKLTDTFGVQLLLCKLAAAEPIVSVPNVGCLLCAVIAAAAWPCFAGQHQLPHLLDYSFHSSHAAATNSCPA